MTKLAGCIILSLAWLPAAHAHMLNMTEIQIAADTTADATVTVRIDLGQSGLMTPESYWDAVSNPESAPKARRLIERSKRLSLESRSWSMVGSAI